VSAAVGINAAPAARQREGERRWRR